MNLMSAQISGMHPETCTYEEQILNQICHPNTMADDFGELVPCKYTKNVVLFLYSSNPA